MMSIFGYRRAQHLDSRHVQDRHLERPAGALGAGPFLVAADIALPAALVRCLREDRPGGHRLQHQERDRGDQNAMDVSHARLRNEMPAQPTGTAVTTPAARGAAPRLRRSVSAKSPTRLPISSIRSSTRSVARIFVMRQYVVSALMKVPFSDSLLTGSPPPQIEKYSQCSRHKATPASCPAAC